MITESTSLPTLLLVLFIGLKLSNVIHWPWVWVLSPVWIPILLIIILATIGVLIEIFKI